MKKLLDPFTYFSGGTTLSIGLFVMAGMIAIAGATEQTFRGVISLGIGDLSYLRLAGQLLAGWGILSGLLYGAGRWFSKSRIRIIDIAGNQALAKLPWLVLLLCSPIYPSEQIAGDVEQLQNANLLELSSFVPSAGLLVYASIALVMLVWFFAWSWRGFSIAANLRGGRAVGLYIGCYLLAEVLAEVLAGWCTHALAGSIG